MPSIDALLDELFEALKEAAEVHGIESHMALRPDPSAKSYFIPAPNPVLSLEEMQRPDRTGPMAEVERVLADLSPAVRTALVGRVKALYEALAAEAADGNAEPPSLLYALH